MTPTSSREFSLRERQSLERLGDLMLPGGLGFPSFRASGCIGRLDEVLAASPSQDIRDLKLLLRLMSYLPMPLVRGLLNIIEIRERFPNAIAAPLRLLNLGLKGVLLSLYYGGDDPGCAGEAPRNASPVSPARPTSGQPMALSQTPVSGQRTTKTTTTIATPIPAEAAGEAPVTTPKAPTNAIHANMGYALHCEAETQRRPQ